LLGAYADLVAVAIESMLLAEEAKTAQVLRATEKLQAAFLNSISLALSTPIMSIVSVLNKLKEKGLELDEKVKLNLLQIALEEAVRVNHMISNLLDMSKIEAGAISPVLKAIDLKEMIDDALIKVNARPGAREARIDIPHSLPPVLADFSLFVQAMLNILDNAFKYSPQEADVDIRVRLLGSKVEIEVADRGVGIPAEDLQRVFEKFYRVEHPQNVTGSALGLTISKGLIELQGGTIVAENRTGGGTIIRLTLPIADSKVLQAY
jgi:two-component system sensor histidine kinase KdpD